MIVCILQMQPDAKGGRKNQEQMFEELAYSGTVKHRRALQTYCNLSLRVVITYAVCISPLCNEGSYGIILQLLRGKAGLLAKLPS